MNGTLPESLRVQKMSRNHDAVLYTTKTQAASFTQQMVKLPIPQQGIMSSTGAYLEFAFLPAFSNAVLPQSVGCAGLVDRIRLVSQSGRIIADQRFFNYKQVVENSFRTAEYAHFIGRYIDGSSFSWCYNDENSPYAPDLRICGDAKTPLGTPVFNGQVWSSPDVLKLSKDPTLAQTWRISLQSAFPMLYSHQLPTSIMEQLYVEVYWTQDTTEGVCVKAQLDASGNPLAGGGAYVKGGIIQQESVFLMSDHIVYRDSSVQGRLEELQAEEGGLSFEFEDYITSVQTSSNFTPTQNYEFNRELGASNYKLCDIKNIQIDASSNLIDKPGFGRYYSNTDKSSTKSLNYVINDVNLFVRNTTSSPESYSRLNEIYPHVDAAIPKPLYMQDINNASAPLSSDQTWNGQKNSDFAGLYSPQAVYLKDMQGRSYQNGNTPVRVFYRGISNADKGDIENPFTNYYFVTYKRMFGVGKAGQIMINDYS